jgi:hypothetical protein
MTPRTSVGAVEEITTMRWSRRLEGADDRFEHEWWDEHLHGATHRLTSIDTLLGRVDEVRVVALLGQAGSSPSG